MAVTPGSIQTAPGQGPGVETYVLDSGIQIPSVIMRGLDFSGTMQAARVDSIGQQLVSDGSTQSVLANVRDRLPPALTNDGSRLRVDATRPELRYEKVLTSTANSGTSALPTLTGDPSVDGLAGEMIVAIADGVHTFQVRKAAGSGTLVWETRGDSATASWDGITMKRVDATTAGALQSGVTTSLETWVGLLPAGAKYIRVRASAVATSVTVRIATSEVVYDPTPSAFINGTVGVSSLPALVASSAIIGATRRATQEFDLSVTAQLANATVTGGTLDLTGSGAAGTNWGEVTYQAVSDVSGTMYLEVSVNGTTWRRLQAFSLTQRITGGLYVADFTYTPGPRYVRGVFTNDATAQTIFHFTQTVR